MVFSISFPSGSCFCDLCKRRLLGLRVKFPHSPILHYAFSSWIEKTMKKKKQYIALGKQICFTIEWGCEEILPNLLQLTIEFFSSPLKKEVLKM